ncbi:MAG: hypothetical protein K9M56_05035 [Victivallales bacterium]|nr:hypothetical protein [Victivallales bacterium]
MRLKEAPSYKFALIYFILSFIHIRVKLAIAPNWFNGKLEFCHNLLLNFQYTNNEQSRLLQFYIPEFFHRLFGLSIFHSYLLQRWLFVFLALYFFHWFLKKWFKEEGCFICVIFLTAVTPLTFYNHLQESAPLLSLTFLLCLWAIREDHKILYCLILIFGTINNETILFMPAIFFFYNFKGFSLKKFLNSAADTVFWALPAYLTFGYIRYLTRGCKHLGNILKIPDNLHGLSLCLQLSPLDYWKAFYFFFIFLYGCFWVFAYLKFREKPFFLRRALLTVPLFIIPHFITGIIAEARQMLPIGFILIPAAVIYLFPNITCDNNHKINHNNREI